MPNRNSEWGATGTTSLRPLAAEFSRPKNPMVEANLRKHLATTVKAFCPKASAGKTGVFIDDVVIALKMYFAARRVHDESLPRKVRENLTNLIHDLEAFRGNLRAIEGHTEVLIGHHLGCGEHPKDGLGDKPITLPRHKGWADTESVLDRLHTALTRALGDAKKLPLVGRLPDHPRLILGRMVADAMQKHLGVRLARTPSGLFYEVLAVLFAEVAKADHSKPITPDREVRSLARSTWAARNRLKNYAIL
jgi:hypothetical protein